MISRHSPNLSGDSTIPKYTSRTRFPQTHRIKQLAATRRKISTRCGTSRREALGATCPTLDNHNNARIARVIVRSKAKIVIIGLGQDTVDAPEEILVVRKCCSAELVHLSSMARCFPDHCDHFCHKYWNDTGQLLTPALDSDPFSPPFELLDETVDDPPRKFLTFTRTTTPTKAAAAISPRATRASFGMLIPALEDGQLCAEGLNGRPLLVPEKRTTN